MRLIFTTSGKRQERALAGEDEYQSALRAYFGIVLDPASV